METRSHLEVVTARLRSYARFVPTPSEPTIGRGVLHLFLHADASLDKEALVAAVDSALADEVQVVSVSLLGHKADFAIMAVASDQWRLRQLQTEVVASGAQLADSYVSLTETSEYYEHMPKDLQEARLYPTIPPEGKPAWCFYPMSKSRDVGANWYELDFKTRKRLMAEHGATGRTYRGRVLQLITGSTGLDEFEWGVTLFSEHPDDLKEVVYTMRYDVASAQYGMFGQFYTGMVAPLDEVLESVGVS